MGFTNKAMVKEIAHNGIGNEARPVWLGKKTQALLDNELKVMTLNIFEIIRKKHMVEGKRIATIQDIETAINEHYEEHVHDIAIKTLDEIKENLYDTLKNQMERLDGYYGKNQTKITEPTQ